MRHWAPTALAAAGCCLIAACGTSATTTGPSPLPLTTTPTTGSTGAPSSTTTTPTTSATATVDPDSDTAIIAAVHAYVTAYQAVGRTASLTPFFAVTTQDCNCRMGLADFVSELAAEKAHTDVKVSADQIKVDSLSGKRAKVDFVLVTDTYRVIRGDGSVLLTAAAARQPTTLNLELTGSTWVAYLSS